MAEPIVVAVVSGVIALGAVARRVWRARAARKRETREKLREAAARLGLEVLEGEAQLLIGLAGRIGEHRVYVDVNPDSAASEQLQTLRVRVESKFIPPQMTVELRAGTGRLEIDTDPLLESALLDPDARALLVRTVLPVFPLKIAEGAVVISLFGREVDVTVLTSVVRGAIEIADRLSMKQPHVAQRLRRTAESGPKSELRIEALNMLERWDLLEHEDLARLCHGLLTDRDIALRLHAAERLGREGAWAALGVAEAPGGVSQRVRALAMVARWAPAAYAEMIARFVVDAREELVESALRSLGTAAPPSFEVGRIEARLIQLVDHGDEVIASAAIDALAHVGTIAAVEPLRALSKGFFAGTLRSAAARAAIAAIQARRGPVEAGALAVVGLEDEVGALSIPEDSGALSVAPEPGQGTD